MSTSTAMETEQEVPPPPSRKRASNQTVDPDDGGEISSAKKSRVAPNKDKKIKCLKFIMAAYKSIHGLVKDADPTGRNINLGNQIANIIFTSFTVLKQRSNNITGNAEKKSTEKKEFTLTSKGVKYTVKVEDAIKLVKGAAQSNGLEFKKFGPTDQENWYGTAAPYLDFFVANNLRLTELRIGHSHMPIGRNGEVMQSFPVEKYGLNGSHHILLEGCTYPPEKRSSMAQSVGPMTALLCHIRTEEKYRRKWTDAAKRAMAHIPVIDEVLDMVKGRKASEVRGIVSLLADILLITTSRQAHRMFFPVNMFCFIAETLKEGKTPSTEAGPRMPVLSLDAFLEAFNVSGNGGFFFYALASQFQWEMEGDMSESVSKQILFHSIFGTYKEDLSILKQITDHGTWNTREEMGDSFKKMTTCGVSKKIYPIALRFYSKLSSANMSGLLSSSYSQVSSLPVFSGSRTQTFSEDFFEQLNKRSGTISLSKTIPQLTSTLVEILTELKEKLVSQNKRLEMGTVKWRRTEGMDIVEGGAEVDTVFVGSGKFFLGRN